jgi:hypothetical protein
MRRNNSETIQTPFVPGKISLLRMRASMKSACQYNLLLKSSKHQKVRHDCHVTAVSANILVEVKRWIYPTAQVAAQAGKNRDLCLGECVVHNLQKHTHT